MRIITSAIFAFMSNEIKGSKSREYWGEKVRGKLTLNKIAHGEGRDSARWKGKRGKDFISSSCVCIKSNGRGRR